jgi:predicted MFS family arabinose efflux permease
LFVLSWFNSIPQSIIPTMLSKISDPKKQGEIVGINSSYLSISKSIGPAIGGMLVGFSYKLPFLFAGFLTLLTAVVAFYAKDRLKELT